MGILKVKNQNGVWVAVPAIEGPKGEGVPSGGTTGQVLKKKTNADYDTEWGNEPTVPVQDVQVNGASVLTDGVANVPISNAPNKLGLVYTAGSGLTVNSNGKIVVQRATDAELKAGNNDNKPVVPVSQHNSVFYGLAKAAGDATQSASSNEVGTYTEEALKSIRKMLGIPNTKWELIKELTTTEDLETVEISTDSNGQSFKLTSVLMLCKTTASTTGTNDYMTTLCRGMKKDGVSVISSFPTLKMANASNALFKYIGEIFPGVGFLQLMGAVASNYNSSSNGALTITSQYMYDYIDKMIFKKYSASSSLVPSGTNIQLYGIRYDE